MTSNIKYFDKQYVATRPEKSVSGSPLGFAVPDGTDSVATKRKATVDRWAGGQWSRDPKAPTRGTVLDNIPSEGFALVDWEGRYSTDNKVVRVVDPRGFELEIYIPNLMDLILNSTIEKGVIKGELVWIRDGANNRLIRADSPEFELAKKNIKKTPKQKLRHEPGDIVVCQDYRYLYLGLLNVDYILPMGPKTINKERSRAYNYRGIQYYDMGMDRLDASPQGRKHVYLAEKWSRGFELDRRVAELRQSQMTTYEIVSSGNELPTYDENDLWAISTDVFYLEDGTVLGWNAAKKHFGDTHKFYEEEGSSFWRVEVGRISDGEMSATPNPATYKRVLVERFN